ncbi:hypothetical protein AMTR_s00075p00150250 [Amborella trichopoda]|uniref:ABC transporter domain-containing protein n=2 Tax=Amborella trichopoda TaxID=13333 RepID=W1P9J9_AMBTC|nr:hypothetical protein AMTR_s00075p00150250 [Amborella trichopoda]
MADEAQVIVPQRGCNTRKHCTFTAVSISYAKPARFCLSRLFSSSTTTITTSTSSSYILREISFTANPTELLAIVGPSGAGKSTLLDILAARTAPTSGHLLLNSAPLHPKTFRRLSAHLPQHDPSLPLLTVLETFSYVARLLLPNLPPPSLSDFLDSLLSDLRLSHVAHCRLAHSLSGGERRRVSIGLALLHDPSVLLLDEPTSGLDSASALHLVRTLRALALARGCTVILSIHQPSSAILSSFHSLLLLSRGSLIHHGPLSSYPLFLSSQGFPLPAQLNPLEYAMDVLPNLQPSPPPPPPPLSLPQVPPPLPPALGYPSSRTNEIYTLCCRSWKIIYRTKQLLLANTLEALIVGLFLGSIYINLGFDKQGIQKRFGLFAFTLTFLLSSTTETLPIFINERPVLIKEISSGVYRVSSHVVAGTIIFMPYLLIVAVIYSASVYFLVGLCRTWEAFLFFVLVVWLVVLMANSFVLFLSTLAPDYIAGTSLVTVCLGGFFLFSGYFISKESMPVYWVFMHYLSIYKYALDALLINEYSCWVSRCFLWFEGGGGGGERTCAVSGGDVLSRRGLHQSHRWFNVHIMFGFFVLFRLLCLAVLSRRASISKK